jgi:hypothetical protein
LTKVEEFCEHLTHSFGKNLSFNSATLKDQKFCFIDELDKLTNRDEQDKITRALFEYKEIQGQPITLRGIPFNVYVSLMKFPLNPGSKESI